MFEHEFSSVEGDQCAKVWQMFDSFGQRMSLHITIIVYNKIIKT